MEWKGDELSLTDATGDWLGGKLAGRVQVGNANGSGFLRSRLDVKGGDLTQAGWTHAGAPVATGTFDLSVALEASGATPEAMAHSASGSGTATFNGMTLNGINSAALPQLIAAADGQKTQISADSIRSVAEAAVFSGQSVVGVVKAPFSVAGGVLRAQNVTAGDGNAALMGAAALDLAAGRIDGGIDLTFRPGEEALSGTEPRVRIGYAGLLEAPGVSLDVADLANFLSLRAFERERRRVEILQANVLRSSGCAAKWRFTRRRQKRGRSNGGVPLPKNAGASRGCGSGSGQGRTGSARRGRAQGRSRTAGRGCAPGTAGAGKRARCRSGTAAGPAAERGGRRPGWQHRACPQPEARFRCVAGRPGAITDARIVTDRRAPQPPSAR